MMIADRLECVSRLIRTARKQRHARSFGATESLNTNIMTYVNNLVQRIPVQTRRNILQGLGQIQNYLEMMIARGSGKLPFQPETDIEPGEIVAEDDAVASPTTYAEAADEDQEEEVVQPPPRPLTRKERRRLNEQQSRG
ncbi:hypothetical protein WDU94_010392 [Cyamophila willieti]